MLQYTSEKKNYLCYTRFACCILDSNRNTVPIYIGIITYQLYYVGNTNKIIIIIVVRTYLRDSASPIESGTNTLWKISYYYIYFFHTCTCTKIICTYTAKIMWANLNARFKLWLCSVLKLGYLGRIVPEYYTLSTYYYTIDELYYLPIQFNSLCGIPVSLQTNQSASRLIGNG